MMKLFSISLLEIPGAESFPMLNLHTETKFCKGIPDKLFGSHVKQLSTLPPCDSGSDNERADEGIQSIYLSDKVILVPLLHETLFDIITILGKI